MKSIGIVFTLAMVSVAAWGRGVWTAEQANAWFAKQPYRAGANYVPAHAVNPIEMWDATTFSPKAIDSEFALAESIGFNTMRVFLSDLVYNADPEGFEKRFNVFLDIAKKHGIGIMPVFFSTAAQTAEGKVGRQPPPNGIHTKLWVQAPCRSVLMDETKWGPIEKYVRGIVTRHAHDSRIVVWNPYNEPGNVAVVAGKIPGEAEALRLRCFHLLEKSLAWTYESNPDQPVTSESWLVDGELAKMFNQYSWDNSDILSYHCYGPLAEQKRAVRALLPYKKPILNTEWMCRWWGCTFNPILGWMKENNIWAYNWGFVAGKTVTWKPFVGGDTNPKFADKWDIWYHDIFHGDYSPYDSREVEYIKKVLGK